MADGRCGDCKRWRYSSLSVGPYPYGRCDKLPTGSPLEDKPKFWINGIVGATIYTAPEFGCALHEAKEVDGG